MENPFTLLKGVGIGAGLMYLFDPEMGRRRRALVRDQWIHLSHKLEDTLRKGMCDLSNRLQGVMSEGLSLFSTHEAPDRVIEERVRAALGRVVSHPSAIEVTAHNGHVVLSGPILASEVDRLIATARSVWGVTGVEDRLEVHEQPGNHPALQGGHRRTGPRPELWQNTWSPATRLMLGFGGVLALTRLLRLSSPTSLAAGLIGASVLAASLAEGPQRSSGQGRRSRGQRPSRQAQSWTSAAL
ncbi:MAG: BON domain-containing protein [Isosphaeraceae bacterium]|nr:BON domain-containing protein [Isosphaeraceae bacterium]